MHVTTNMYRIVTLKANVEKIITLKCIWHHICTIPLLWRQMLRISLLENAFDTKYVQNHYFERLILWKLHHCKNAFDTNICTKFITLKANAQKIAMLKMHVAQHMCKTVTLKANAKEIITLKCVWHQICTKSLLWRQMLRKSLLENACGTTYVLNHYFEGKC